MFVDYFAVTFLDDYNGSLIYYKKTPCKALVKQFTKAFQGVSEALLVFDPYKQSGLIPKTYFLTTSIIGADSDPKKPPMSWSLIF